MCTSSSALIYANKIMLHDNAITVFTAKLPLQYLFYECTSYSVVYSCLIYIFQTENFLLIKNFIVATEAKHVVTSRKIVLHKHLGQFTATHYYGLPKLQEISIIFYILLITHTMIDKPRHAH